jgi:DegV family protein with EDD domain
VTSIQVLVDSSAGISPELARQWDVDVVPFYLTWDDCTYRDGVDLLPADFYAMLAETDRNAKTAAPNPADFARAYAAAIAKGHPQVLVVTPSPAMSAAHANACLAAREFGEDRAVVLNSGQGAGAQALIAASAARLASQGRPVSEIVAAAETACRFTEMWMAVGTLRYLRRSGRLPMAKAVIGELINMKPILTFADGRLTVRERPRTMRRAVAYLVDLVGEGDPEHVLVMYADDRTGAAELAGAISERLPHAEVDMSPVSGVVGGHTGPGLLGVAVRRPAR